MMRCIRIWTGGDGNSDFAEGTIFLSGHHGRDTLSGMVPAASISFRETPPGGDFAWHNDPTPQLVLTLSGTLRFTVKSGRSFDIRPGDILFAEDHTGTGHTWRLLDDQPWRRAYVIVHDLNAVPFTPDTTITPRP